MCQEFLKAIASILISMLLFLMLDEKCFPNILMLRKSYDKRMKKKLLAVHLELTFKIF